MINYFSYKNISYLLALGFIFFGLIFGLLTKNLSVKRHEFFIFLAVFVVFQCLWIFIAHRKTLMGIEKKSSPSVNNILFFSSAALFLSVYFASAYLGSISSFFVVDLFGVYKEFGLHVDALNRMVNGSCPWLDFAYPYGFFPIYLSYLLWNVGVNNANSVLYVYLLFNVMAVLLFLFVLKKNSSKKIYLLSSASYLIYLLPNFFQSFNEGGLHSNWFRYLSPMLLIILFPEGRLVKLKAFLSGLCLVGIFLISPELLVFIILSSFLYLLFYLYYNRGEIKNLFFIFCGIIAALFIFFIILPSGDLIVVLNNIYQNVFYQAKMIINNSVLSIRMPNLFTAVYLFFQSPSIDALKNIYISFIFYLPPIVLAWILGVIYKNKNNSPYVIKLGLFWVAIFSTYLKALGASSLSYALLSTPLLILAISFIHKEAKKVSWKALIFVLFFILISSLWQIQQRYFPCLISDGYACGYSRDKRNIDKVVIPLSLASGWQYFYKDDVDDFVKIVDFLNTYGQGNVLILSDMTSLYYFSKDVDVSRIMLPSLYYDKSDLMAFDKPVNANIVVVPFRGYNYVDFNIDYRFPVISSNLRQNYKNIGSCGPFEFYLKNNLDISSDYLKCKK